MAISTKTIDSFTSSQNQPRLPRGLTPFAFTLTRHRFFILIVIIIIIVVILFISELTTAPFVSPDARVSLYVQLARGHSRHAFFSATFRRKGPILCSSVLRQKKKSLNFQLYLCRMRRKRLIRPTFAQITSAIRQPHTALNTFGAPRWRGIRRIVRPDMFGITPFHLFFAPRGTIPARTRFRSLVTCSGLWAGDSSSSTSGTPFGDGWGVCFTKHFLHPNRQYWRDYPHDSEWQSGFPSAQCNALAVHYPDVAALTSPANRATPDPH